MRKILLIDDSPLSRNMLKRALTEEYTCIEAVDGMSGLEKYFLEKPDLVIMDITMPGASGLEVLAQLKQMDPQARVIMGTADIQTATRAEALQLGALALINKPFEANQVQEIVRRILDTSQPA